MTRIKCCKCGNWATWYYMPGYEDKIPSENYFCDKHVPRGCSCNEYNVVQTFDGKDFTDYPKGIEGKDWKWKEKDKVYTELDEGKELPCCEFEYCKNGYNEEEEYV